MSNEIKIFLLTLKSKKNAYTKKIIWADSRELAIEQAYTQLPKKILGGEKAPLINKSLGEDDSKIYCKQL